MSEIPQNQEPEQQPAPEEILASKQPVASGRAPISEERLQELRKVFGDFKLSRKTDKGEELVSFTPEEIESIMANKQVKAHTTIPETVQSFLASRVLENVGNLQISLLDWKKVILMQPIIIYSKPETINKNVEDSAKILGLEKKYFINAALDHPQLFYLNPETINRNIEESAQALAVGKKDFAVVALKAPALFYQNPETINRNIEESARMLSLSKEDYIRVAIKQPQLFSQKPETIEHNISESAEILGVPKKDFIIAAIKQPQLFAMKPETINSNVEGSVKKIGLDKKDFIAMALRLPSLFVLKPETIENKYRLYQSILPDNKPKNFIKYPVLFGFSPERILAHYIVGKLSGRKMVLKTFNKNPVDFAEKELSPEDINLFKPTYEYLTTLSNKMRKRSRKRGEETKIYEQMTAFVEKFFGKKDEPLTKDKIEEFKKFIAKHIENKE